MNSRLYLCILLANLLTIVNSLVIKDEAIDNVNINNFKAKYKRKFSSSSTTKGKNFLKNALKYIAIVAGIIILVIILILICCCYGCCVCCSSGKKEKYEVNNSTSKPYSSNNEDITISTATTSVQPPTQPQPAAYNPIYPSYGNYQQPQGSYPPAGSYPPPSAPYAQPMQPMYPNV